MLYTRKGDDGTTGTFGSKTRLPKDSMLFEALGTVDELNSLLGVCFAKAASLPEEYEFVQKLVRRAQEDLFIVQAELAGADKKIAPERVEWLEAAVGEIETKIEPPSSFLIAGASELSSFFDFARTIARRAERAVIRAGGERAVSEDTRRYLNRLSSLLYALARFEAGRSGQKEKAPSY